TRQDKTRPNSSSRREGAGAKECCTGSERRCSLEGNQSDRCGGQGNREIGHTLSIRHRSGATARAAPCGCKSSSIWCIGLPSSCAMDRTGHGDGFQPHYVITAE